MTRCRDYALDNHSWPNLLTLTMDYFELYGLPPTFKPDAVFVKRRYLELSRQYHPDFFTNESPEKQAEVLQVSSQVNEAYKVLLNQEKLIRYVLKEKGLLEDEEKYKLDAAFLGEMMDINEQLMDAEMDGDSDTIATVERDTLALQTKIYNDVAEILESDQAPVDSGETMLQVKSYYYRKKYLQRILDKLASMRNIAALSPGGGIGRRSRLKICRSQECIGSIPIPGTAVKSSEMSGLSFFLVLTLPELSDNFKCQFHVQVDCERMTFVTKLKKKHECPERKDYFPGLP